MNKRNISFVKWSEIRDKVLKVNEPLAAVIDQINPKDQHELIQINYFYGDIIIKNGILQIPDKQGELTALKTGNFSKDIINALSYQGIPLFLSLKNDNEVFIDTGSRSIPLNLFHQGSLLGLFETANYIFGKPNEAIWSVSAGAKSIFMLPKISDEIGLKRLRKYYNLPVMLKLKKLTDHFEIFKLISNNDNFSQPWNNKIICFTEKWLNQKFLKKYPVFRDHILKENWSQSQFAIENLKLSLVWEKFSEATALRNLNPGPFLTNQAKHLLNIATGNLPSFRPTLNSQSIAPILGLQTAIMDVYGLKKNVPIVMSLYEKKINQNLPLYYSLSYPSIFEGSPLNKGTATISENLRNLKILMDTLQQYVGINKFENTFLANSQFEYFHIEQDLHKDFLLSSKMIDNEDFLYYKKQFSGLEFPYASYFWNGCIKITTKE